MIRVLETDLKRIRVLAVEREEENRAFRQVLETWDSARLDGLVHRLYQEVAAVIDCMACGNCCKTLRVTSDEEDIEQFARHLGCSTTEFRAQYLVLDQEHQCIIFKELPCPFLHENQCLHYAHRPKRCAEYPHLDKAGFLSRLPAVLRSYGICPLVFNVYERLKEETGFRNA